MRTSKLYPAWKDLLKVAAPWEYGSFHTHEEIALIIGVSTSAGERYYRLVQRANVDLLELHQKYLRNVPGRGYRVINPQEHLPESSRIVKLAGKKLRRGISVAANVNRGLLTVEENNRVSSYLSRAGQLKAITESETLKLGRTAARASQAHERPKLAFRAEG